jgi:adenylate kinase
MNIIIFGPQASGKGTQAKFLAEKLGLFYVSTGDLFRQLSKTNSEVKNLVEKGELPSDDLAFSLLTKFIETNHKNYDNIIFDGFPRNVNQFFLLKSWLSKHSSKVDNAILLNIGDEEAIRRLSARRICTNCKEIFNLITKPPKNKDMCDKCGGELFQREDDKVEAIEKRLKLYREVTKPLIDIFNKERIFVEVNGERPIEKISEELLNILQK